METIMGIVMGIIFFLIILCTGGWMFYMGVRMLFAEKIPKLGLSVREYTKQAEAVITKQEIRRGHHYAFRYIEYRYTVNGNEYTGEDNISYYDKTKQAGMKITINYKENNPSEACFNLEYLREYRQRWGSLYTIFGMFF